MHVDFKITTWERAEIPKEHEAEVMKLIKDGTITSSADISHHIEGTQFETLYDTEEQITPEENGGCSTIEIWEGKENLWENGKEE